MRRDSGDLMSRNKWRAVGEIAIALFGTLTVGTVTVMGILTMFTVYGVVSQVMVLAMSLAASLYVVLSGVRLIESSDRSSKD